MEDGSKAPGAAELQKFVEEEDARAEIAELVGTITEVCWDKCITSTPSGKFSSRETACLTNCAERFMETCAIILEKIEVDDEDDD